jgi:hypothetical protein
VFIALAVALILLLPWIAMQFSAEVAWSGFDFAFAGALLFGAGLAIDLIARKAGTLAYRAALGAALAAAVLLVWVNLAVGILGPEDNPANGLYLGVLAVLMVGALIARLRPRGMALALFATALAQGLATVMGLLTWKLDLASAGALAGVLKAVGVNAFFVALWIGSGLLFQRARSGLDPAEE